MARGFSGVQKAAILVMQVGKDRAAPLLRSMREQEVAEIMAEVARLHHLELHEIEEVMDEFRDTFTARAHVAQGGYQTARELLESSFGGNKADEILDNLGVTMVAAPFEFLRRADTRQVLTYLQDEHPQTIALVAEDAEFSRNACEGARENVKKYGFKSVYDKSYPPSTTDYTPIMRADVLKHM